MFIMKSLYILSLLYNTISIPIIKYNGCCIEYGLGSMMNKCCYTLTDVMDSLECNTNHTLLGTMSEYHNTPCNNISLHL